MDWYIASKHIFKSKTKTKNDKYQFIGLLDIQQSEFFATNTIDTETKKKIFFTLPFIAFPLMIIFIISFVFAMNQIETHQLKKYGVIELVRVKKIEYTIKQIPYNHIEYNNGKNSTNLPQENYKINEQIRVIYSKYKPEIVTYYKD